jgi:hypothetical protein
MLDPSGHFPPDHTWRAQMNGTVRWLCIPGLALSLGLFWMGCPPAEDTGGAGGEETAAAVKADPPAERTDLAGLAHNTSLVPSPTEVQEAMLHAGVDGRFENFLLRKTMDLTDEDKEEVALRTGIVLADLVLTLNNSEKDVLLKDLAALRTGLSTIGAGSDIDTTLGQVIEHVEADAVTRQELWVQVEEMREAVYGELAMEAGSQTVPLVQAGSWLEGTHLLAEAILASSERGDALNLLRQPDVVAYFLAQLKAADAQGAEFPMVTLTRGTLEQMHDIAAKETLTEEDVTKVRDLTGDLLNQLAGN